MRAALLRTLRSRTLWLLAALIALSMPLAKLTGPAPLPERAAFCIVPGHADGEALRARLTEQGFLEAPDEAALREGLARGDWGCGLALEGEGALFLQTENAADPALWRGAAAAALFSVEAPYFTAEALAIAGIPAEEAFARYAELYAAGSPFHITLENVQGQAPAENTLPRDRTLLAGAAACLLGAVFAAVLPAWEDARLLGRRGFSGKIRRSVLWGQLALRCAVLAAAAVLGAILAGQGSLALRLVPYLLAWALLAALAVGLTRRPGLVSVAAALCCLLLPVLCPVYADVSLLAPKLAPVQKLFLPWWLFYGL